MAACPLLDLRLMAAVRIKSHSAVFRRARQMPKKHLSLNESQSGTSLVPVGPLVRDGSALAGAGYLKARESSL